MKDIGTLIVSAGTSPLTLVAFVFFLIARIIKSRPNQHAYLIAIGVLVIILSFGLEYKKLSEKTEQPAVPMITPTATNTQGHDAADNPSPEEAKDAETSGDTITTSGDNSPAFKQSGTGSVNINYGK